MRKKIAIIDLGSNSVRMIIMKIYEDGSYKMMDQAKEMVRLSEDMGDEMTLKPLAIKRTLFTLKLFKKLIEAHKADEVFAIATAAVRNAVNQQAFLDKIKLETGFDFRVISGEEEAYLDYMGVINSIKIGDCVIVDIGGASTELVWVENRRMKEAISLPFGAVTLTEKFLGKGNYTQEGIKKLIDYVTKQYKDIEWLSRVDGLPVVGLGGSIRTLAKIDKRKIGFPLESLHNYTMEYKEVLYAYDLVTKANIESRKDIPGVEKDRADIIAGGLVPVKALMDLLKADKIVISGNGLREGMFFKYYLETLGYEDEILEDVLSHSVENTLKNYDVNLEHCEHVTKLALSIFDQLQPLHGYGEEERKLLYVGAQLHDIGMYVDYYNHHKHGFYLALNSRLNGLRNRELVMCAFIVAMHRNEEFKVDWKNYNMLIDKNDYEIIKRLSVFVRIAEKLDRNESGSVEDISCYITPDSVQMMLKTSNTPELEIAAAMKSDRVFEKLFNKKLYIV
ncbi:exopolyphosphatase / guanosine-5'-triphosphate,3'-diphosphate pyrophosphatase [Geosporobacter subterraneus DSM 17957]|uniref:Exopolyphosphatase n=1 Tax=Geosporobacter subterraneus DSM 17957 TaxID=1121919 RepID=A0A1M6FJP4_9FIRM|nr:exopolyphosphatase [Geosporobacter subterraneus]SHI97863.1 exopolyphosphatase / guanosine-5'-triphosphate,3'-diphosphate pyrophosphatase [Geosporobacter subterraneus DSM 17957]